VAVRYATADGPVPNGARAVEDYVATSGTATFLPGQTVQRVMVTVNPDTKHEPDEVFFFNLTSSLNATIADPQAAITIRNDDATPTLSIQSGSITEGNSGVTTAHLKVVLSNPTSDPVRFDYATANGSAVAPSDYAAGSGTKFIAPGLTSTQVDVSVNGDRLVEGNEVMHVIISNALNALLGNSVGDLTINNDDFIIILPTPTPAPVGP